MNHPAFKAIADDAVVLHLLIIQCDDEWTDADRDKRLLLLHEAAAEARTIARRLETHAVHVEAKAT
jgi:hypothetical protein